MGMYTLEEVITRWRRGKLTSEQAIGQLLQIVSELNQRMGQVEQHLFNGGSRKGNGGDKAGLDDSRPIS